MPVAERGGLRLVDLFAGCGGFTQGFVSTGAYAPVGAVERDVDAAATYTLNFGAHVATMDVERWNRGSLPRADVVIGGPPCQGFSPLGTRDQTDVRNDLWREFVRAVGRVRPAFFVLENVPQFLASSQFRALRSAVAGGALAAWRLEAHILDAADYGAAQRRRRAIVIGRPAGMRPLGAPPPVGSTAVLADVLRHVRPVVTETDLPACSVTVDGRRVAGAFRGPDLHVTSTASDIALRRYRAVPPGGGRRDLPEDLRLPAWRGDYRGAADVMGRLRWDRPAVTIRTGFHRPEKGRFLHPEQDRALTHYEAALVQGFPDDFAWCGSKASIARQIGNAVPVPLAAAVGSHLAGHFNSRKPRSG